MANACGYSARLGIPHVLHNDALVNAGSHTHWHFLKATLSSDNVPFLLGVSILCDILMMMTLANHEFPRRYAWSWVWWQMPSLSPIWENWGLNKTLTQNKNKKSIGCVALCKGLG